MKKILIWVLLPLFGNAQKFDAVFDYQVTSKYDKASERFIKVDTAIWPVYITKTSNQLKINGIVYEIVPDKTIIDSFYLDDGEEKVYDIEYTCTLKNFNRFIVINIVTSDLGMYYFTVAQMMSGECLRKEYTNFEL